ncbi:MAG: NTP transferase domain-containing protein [Chloroflexi bacterium]|nr:NTP transferase domain-containing protein [Chloroflexota bacterium]
MLSAIITTSDPAHLGEELTIDEETGLSRIENVLFQLLQSPVDEVIVVSGYHHDKLEDLLARRPCRIVQDRLWHMGDIMWSVQEGLRHVSAKSKTVLVCSGADADLSLEDVETLVKRQEFMGDEHLYHAVRQPGALPLFLLPRRFWPDFQRVRPGTELHQYLRTQLTALENVVLI